MWQGGTGAQLGLLASSWGQVRDVVLLLGALVLLVLVGGVILLLVRRQIFSSTEASSGGLLTLHDIRELHRAGKLSDEEFEAARAVILGQAGAASRERPDQGKRSPARPVRAEGEAPGRAEAEWRAPPGFDLTGEPLPDQDEPGPESTDPPDRT